MMFERWDGVAVEIKSSRRIQDIRDQVILNLRKKGFSVVAIADALNCSREQVFRRLRVLRERPRDEPDLVPVGTSGPGWERQTEGIPAGATCPRCGNSIAPGSHFVCLACMRAGTDPMA